MADEAQLTGSLTINKGNLSKSLSIQFKADIEAADPGGPSPGTVVATTTGVNVSLAALTNPSLCIIENLDAQAGNIVYVGISDGTEFYTLLEIWPGEGYPLRLSRFLATSLGAGTGTADTGAYTLHVRSTLNDARVNFLVFER